MQDDEIKLMGAETARFSSAKPNGVKKLQPGERGHSDRDLARAEKLNLRKLKSLTDEFEYLSKKFKGSKPKSVRNRLQRLEIVIQVKTEIYKEALKID